jgi:AAA+ superfamily predicted ATPase
MIMRIRRPTKNPNLSFKPDQNFDITKEVHDDIGFLMLIDTYLRELHSIKSGNGTEESFERCDYIRKKVLDIINNCSTESDSIFLNILRRVDQPFEDIAIFSAILLSNCMHESFVSQSLNSEYDEDEDRIIIEHKTLEDYCLLKDILGLVYPEITSKNLESYISRLIEYNLIELQYPNNVKLKGDQLFIKLSEPIINLLGYFKNSDEASSKVIQMKEIEQVYHTYGDLIMEDREVLEMIDDVRRYLSVQDKNDIPPLKVLLCGEDRRLIEIISLIVAYECKRSIFISDTRSDDFFPFILSNRKKKKVSINETNMLMGWFSGHILRMDMHKSNDFNGLHWGLERLSKLIKRSDIPVIITSYLREPEGLSKSDILKYNYRILKVSKISREIQKRLLIRLLDLNNLKAEDIDFCIPEDGLSLSGIELIAQVARRESKLLNKEIDLDMLKDISIRVSGGIEEDELTRNEEENEDGDFISVETRIEERLSDLVLNDSVKAQVDLLLYAINNTEKIYENLPCYYTYGKGIKALFYGPPGTGKTFCVRAIARETGRGLITLNFSKLFDKFVGETEKHITRYFEMAKKNNAILFIDECDALIMSRDALYRTWEFSFINTFLKEMEQFNGILILSTNYETIKDKAINRRIPFFVKFENPDYKGRLILLKRFIPEKYLSKFDIEEIARVEFNGGNLKNVWLRMYISIIKNEAVDTKSFIEALKDELQKEAADKNGRNKRAGF